MQQRDIRIGLDIATNTGYCVIANNKIIQLGVKKLWYKGDYERTVISCYELISSLLDGIALWIDIAGGYYVCIELSKYGNNTTYIFSMLTGIIVDNIYKISSLKTINTPIVKLIDPKSWQKHIGIVKGEDTKQRSIEIANNTIHNENIVSPHKIQDDNEADAFNLAYYGVDVLDIFEIKQIQLGKKKKKMSIQRALSTLYKREHQWLQKLDEAHQLEEMTHTKKAFNKIKKCEKKLVELQEQINKIKEEE